MNKKFRRYKIQNIKKWSGLSKVPPATMYSISSMVVNIAELRSENLQVGIAFTVCR
uniref:Uncharacterized protein n=1 Tax=Marseillevirus LCMAC202 TaxID=2506606 RepID=A0A481YY46_9VIRU|nr:MAG: hypothetical protein LCMAC202_05350 [Marseillevirus LCMAC202]